MTEDLTDESLENQQQRYTDEWRTIAQNRSRGDLAGFTKFRGKLDRFIV
jgi:hypothetical protein